MTREGHRQVRGGSEVGWGGGEVSESEVGAGAGLVLECKDSANPGVTVGVGVRNRVQLFTMGEGLGQWERACSQRG